MRMALVDGEHYPDVTAWAIEALGDICCAVFLGGSEKVGSIESLAGKLGIRVYSSDNYLTALKQALRENRVEEVVDLSDEPVLTYEDRFKIASLCLMFGVPYRGADFHFLPKPLNHVKKPSIGVIGTGKRVGKTAVSGFLARTLKKICEPVIVTMGRGGPERPELIRGDEMKITPEYLVELMGEGEHAASDHLEDALTSAVKTIGCRRCGGGMAGFPFFDVVDRGVKLAESLPVDLVILEGSGATFPAYRADAYVVVVGAKQPLTHVSGYFGPLRLAFADVVVVTMADAVSESKLEKIERVVMEVNPGIDVHFTAFRPRPLGDVKGRRIGLVMTSTEAAGKARSYLEAIGADVRAVSGNLANRPRLIKDLQKFEGMDAVAVELKAAAVDVVTRWALERGMEVVYLDNEPLNIDGKDLRAAFLRLGKRILGDGG
ncbi:2,3-diphosphoglycerate synthetase [Thermococcus sp.]|uniref:2,3-diphosphoglycerate synthetase n=1 Tax=Thermococcus sp. TaxID=35749 RepID=UPI0025FF6561|nr:2,3-diphosphoglycerate synthetase [Thermococcus sp.]